MENYYPLGTKIEREFNCGSIILTTVVTAFDLETKQYILEWEEKNEDTENKNNYTRRQIGKYLHPDEMEKIELGEDIRKKFRDGLGYDGIIESINLDKNLYHVKYNHGDEEDMTISDIRKHWVEKEKVNKNSSSK